MNLADLDIFPQQIRDLQAQYPQAHRALRNWAAWSRDCRPPCGRGVAPCHIWTNYIPGEDYADDEDPQPTVESPVKADRHEREEYDEIAAEILDERMHGAGGLAEYQLPVVRAAYYTRYLPESQMPGAVGLKRGEEHRFREWLEGALIFVSRFA